MHKLMKRPTKVDNFCRRIDIVEIQLILDEMEGHPKTTVTRAFLESHKAALTWPVFLDETVSIQLGSAICYKH